MSIHSLMSKGLINLAFDSRGVPEEENLLNLQDIKSPSDTSNHEKTDSENRNKLSNSLIQHNNKDDITSNQQSESSFDDSFRISCRACFFSHVLLYLIIALGCIIAFVSLCVNKVPSYQSANSLSNNFEDDPFYVVQISDPHLTHVYPDNTDIQIQVCNNISTKINPSIVLITGDLVDSNNSTNVLGFHQQYEKNWIEYKRMKETSILFQNNVNLKKYNKLNKNNNRIFKEIENENKMLVIETAGNHDMMVVPRDDMNSNSYRRHIIGVDADFVVESYKVDTVGPKKMNFIRFNPLKPPFTSGPLGVLPYIYKDDLDKLEEAMDKSGKYINVIISHFSYYNLFSIGENKYNHHRNEVFNMADLFIAGHAHYEWTEIMRFSNTLEVTAKALVMYPIFYIFSFDNNNIRTKEVDATEDEYLMITYPIPSNQVTGRTVFNINSFPIRVLSFGPKPIAINDKKVYVKVDNNEPYEMSFIKEIKYYNNTNNKINNEINSKVYLYSLSVTVKNGPHKIKVFTNSSISSNTIIDETIEFFVGKKSAPVYELHFTVQSPMVLYACPLVCFIYIGLQLLPFWKIEFIKKCIDEYENYFYFNKNGDKKIPLIKEILEGPLYFVTRVRKIPNKLYYLLIYHLLCFLILPMYFMKIKERTAINFVWGTAVDFNEFRPYSMLGFLFLIYIFFYLYPLLNQLQLLFEIPKRGYSKTKLPLTFIIESAIYWFFMTIAGIFWAIITTLAGSIIGVFTSIVVYTIFISYFYIIYIYYKTLTDKYFYVNEKNENTDSKSVISIDDQIDHISENKIEDRLIIEKVNYDTIK